MKIKYSHNKRIEETIEVNNVDDILNTLGEEFKLEFNIGLYYYAITKDYGTSLYVINIVENKNTDKQIVYDFNNIQLFNIKTYFNILFKEGFKKALAYLEL